MARQTSRAEGKFRDRSGWNAQKRTEIAGDDDAPASACLFLAAMQNYFQEWKIAHPYFEDFRNSIIQFTGVDLNWFFDQWFTTTKRIDYGIKKVKKGDSDGGHRRGRPGARRGGREQGVSERGASNTGAGVDVEGGGAAVQMHDDVRFVSRRYVTLIPIGIRYLPPYFARVCVCRFVFVVVVAMRQTHHAY